jgi:hypothetical protein
VCGTVWTKIEQEAIETRDIPLLQRYSFPPRKTSKRKQGASTCYFVLEPASEWPDSHLKAETGPSQDPHLYFDPGRHFPRPKFGESESAKAVRVAGARLL